MQKFKVIYRKRNYSIVKVEYIEAASKNDALWEAFRYARVLGLNADIFEA